MTAEQVALAAAYDDGWTMAVFATSPEDMNGEAQLLRALEFPPVDNPHREAGSPTPARLATVDRAVVAHELAVAVDGGTDDLSTWLGIVASLVKSGVLTQLSEQLSEPTAARAVEAVLAVLDSPAVRAADGNGGESFVSVSAVREALLSVLPVGANHRKICSSEGGCGDPDCADCRTEWGRL